MRRIALFRHAHRVRAAGSVPAMTMRAASRVSPWAAAAAIALITATMFAPTASAAGPSPTDSNGRAVIVACPDGTSSDVPADSGSHADCLSLTGALTEAVNNGVPDDLILLRPGLYCPVDLPNTYGRLYLQGIPRSAFAAGSGADVGVARTHSEAEDVTFASYATDSCTLAPESSIIHETWGHGSSGFVFLQNLAVDGASALPYTAGTTGAALYGIRLDDASTYLRDVVVKHAQIGLSIDGGQVTHSAFVDNLAIGVQTTNPRPTWVQDTLIANTVNVGGNSAGIGFSDDANSAASTLRNVTITGNTIGLGRRPQTSNANTSIVNSLIAGNGTDCDYWGAGMNGSPTGNNAVGPTCTGLALTSTTVTLDDGYSNAIGPVDYLSHLEPVAESGFVAQSYTGDATYCSSTDQVELQRPDCRIGAVQLWTAPGTPPASTWIDVPASLDLSAGDGQLSLANRFQGLVTVRGVSASEGFSVSRDDCSLGTLVRSSFTDPAGLSAQPYCTITVSATGSAASGTLTIATSVGTLTVALTADGASPSPSPSDTPSPTPSPTTTAPSPAPSPTTTAPTPTPTSTPTPTPTPTPSPAARPPAAPGKVKASARKHGAHVTWKKASRATSYLVQVKGTTSWTTKATLGVRARATTLHGLKSHVRVKVRVVAVNSGGTKASKTVSVRPR